MAQNSKIEWTTHTFNPWEGCRAVSPGCAHCYAKTLVERFGKDFGVRRRTSVQNWNKVLRWNREAPPPAPAPRVFCASLADWLDDEVPIEWLADLLKLIHQTPNLDWLMLTKRPQNWRSRILSVMDWLADTEAAASVWWDTMTTLGRWLNGHPPENIWLGTTVEDQTRADERIPLLLDIPARIRFLSCEPLLGQVDLKLHCKFDHNHDGDCHIHRAGCPRIDWVICGGESGKDTRPMHPDWARSLRDQCLAAKVPFLFKQWGEWLPYTQGDAYMDSFQETRVIPNGPGATGWPIYRVGKKAAGRILDGIEWNQYPA